MQSYRIAVRPGDGVGDETSEEAVRILKAAADIHGFEIDSATFNWSCDRYLGSGEMMPADALETPASARRFIDLEDISFTSTGTVP